MNSVNHLDNGLWVQIDNTKLYEQYSKHTLAEALSMFPVTEEECLVKQYPRKKWTKI